MLAEKAESSSQYSADFRTTLQTLAAQARNAARWGHALLLISLILLLVGGTFLTAKVLSPEGGIAGTVSVLGCISLVLALMRIAFLLLQRSWELENEMVRLRVRADFSGDPTLAADMIEILGKESGRVNKNRVHRRPFLTLVRRGLGPKKDLARSARVQHLLGALETGVPDLAENHRTYILESLEHGG